MLPILASGRMRRRMRRQAPLVTFDVRAHRRWGRFIGQAAGGRVALKGTDLRQPRTHRKTQGTLPPLGAGFQPAYPHGSACSGWFARSSSLSLCLAFTPGPAPAQTTGANEVTKVRILGDSRENERRINEEVNRQGRRQKLLYEAESSARQNAAVAMKWSALFDKEIPQELLAEIELQRDSCERIIQSKDRLIKEFKAELKAKDDEYVKSLKKQSGECDARASATAVSCRAVRQSCECAAAVRTCI